MSHELFNIREWQTQWFAKALREGRFETWFQPIVDTGSQNVAGHECLIRYRTEGKDARTWKGAEILDAARARNDIRVFDAHARALAVRSAAVQRKSSRENAGDNHPFFVNFLPASIPDSENGPEIAMRPVMDALACTGMCPADFVFEVVEADLVGDSMHLRRIQSYLKHMGFGFALDNVGIGAEPLQWVSDLRPDYIKIDQRVTRNIEQPIYAATVRKLTQLSDELGVKTIAVGVHRKRMLENLWLLGVEIMQGFLFGRPAPGVVRTMSSSENQYAMQDADLANLAQALAMPSLAPQYTDLLLVPSERKRGT
jgi:EAL domain-containing protein (putative c-di-GMP-specific phosphodiesterase class I)